MTSASADEVIGSSKFLSAYLAPFLGMLERPDVTDIYVNRPREFWVETLGGAIDRHVSTELTEPLLARLSRQIAAISHQGVSREHPLLSATLPDGARVQIIAPPATRGGTVLAIRKQVSPHLSLDDYEGAGAFATTERNADLEPDPRTDLLYDLHAAGDIRGLLKAAVLACKNILISGGTSTGKTTFLSALLREIPADERLILIEDTPELQLHHDNAIGLLATRGEQGEARITTNDLLSASLRMRPDRIIVGELRGPEAFTFLRAVNTGHPGSMTTVHAHSPARAIEQIALLVLQSGAQLKRDEVRDYVRSTVDVYVQLARTGGRRHVSAVALARHSSAGSALIG